MKYFYLLLFILIPSLSNAQEDIKNDSIPNMQAGKEMVVTISSDEFSVLKSENDKLKSDLLSLEKKYKELFKRDSISNVKLSRNQIEIEKLKKDTIELHNYQKEANRCLVNVSSNFLYIPYEAYSIENIAIPAYNAISDNELKKEHRIKYRLLESYKKDIEEILSLIDFIEVKLSEPFVKNSSEVLPKFQESSVYVSYNQYQDWKNTYLGLKLVVIENQLNVFDGNKNKFDFETIKTELNQCLKTTENL